VKFIVDAHLPRSLVTDLQKAVHDALHTMDLPAQNRTSDDAISELSVRDQRVVITKDADFFYSHILHNRPWKLLLVRTGNMGTGALRAIFSRHLRAIEDALQTHSLVELDRQTVTMVR
jgi:predicted nuclease of predicted toxin-antitoxin system